MNQTIRLLLSLFERAEVIVEKEMLEALATDAQATAAERTQHLTEIQGVLLDLRARAVGTGETPGRAWDVIRAGYRTGSDDALTTDAPFTETSFGGIHQDTAEQLFIALAGRLDEAIGYTGRKAEDAFREATLRETLVGQLSGRPRGEITKAIVRDLESRGVKAFRDKAGKEWGLTSYAKMAANSAGSEAHTYGTLNRLAENGIDLVKVSEHDHPADVCSRYEGKVFSISGTHPTYPALEEAPPFHPFCKHLLMGYVESLRGAA